MDVVRRALRGFFGGRSGPLLIALVACLILLAITRPNYFTVDNVRVIGLNVTSVAIASVGTAFLLSSGRIDLSIGSIFAATVCVGALLSVSLPPWLAWGGAMATGAAIGLLNGFLTWRIRVSPLIVTLAMLALIRGRASRGQQWSRCR
jgi:ribose transport system permease protein